MQLKKNEKMKRSLSNRAILKSKIKVGRNAKNRISLLIRTILKMYFTKVYLTNVYMLWVLGVFFQVPKTKNFTVKF